MDGAAGLVAMIVYGEFAYEQIVQYGTLSKILFNNAHRMITIATGMTMVIISGRDLSVGAVIAFSSVSGVLLIDAGLNPALIVGALALGLMNVLIAGDGGSRRPPPGEIGARWMPST